MAIHLLKTKEVLTRPDGLHSDGGGLCLRVQSQGRSRSWVYRYKIGKAKKLVSLGSVKDLTIDKARKLCAEINEAVANGEKPDQVIARQSLAVSHYPLTPASGLFADILDESVTAIANVKRWRGKRTESEWRQTLADYALPVLGDIDVADIEAPDIVAVLDPIWESKNPTAQKVLSHLTAIFDWCIAKGYRKNKNPALWRELQFSLPPPARVHQIEHLKAAKLSNVPRIAKELWVKNSLMYSAALFGMLTATRVGEFIGARWDEIDFEEKVWSVPPGRRKDGVPYPHRVPLSRQALAVLARQPRKSDLIFPGRYGSSVCEDSPRQALHRLGYKVTMHGMRSVFCDWCAKNKVDWVAREKALSHSVGNKVTQAYLRTDMLEERRVVMQQWADFLFGEDDA